MGRFLLMLSLLWLPLLLHADATRQDWLGEYAMNHDGHPGTLRIVPSQRRCRIAGCPELDVQYSDEHGSTYPGSVDTLDENGQHMTFTVDFPGNQQAFSIYIFTFDKTRLAGTTVWGGRTFGVMATKSGRTLAIERTDGRKMVVPRDPAAMATQRVKIDPEERTAGIGAKVGARTAGSAPAHVLLPDGSIETHYPDGSIHTNRIGQCGGTIHYPDGRLVKVPCTRAAVIPMIPPPPPAGSKEERWLNGQDAESMQVLQGVLGGADSASFHNYKANYETPPNPSIYQRIELRMQAISALMSVPQ